MIVDPVYETVQRLMGKHSAGGYLSDTDFNKFANLSQNQKLEFELDTSQSTYNLETTSDFKLTKDVSVVNGILQEPENYRYFESARAVDFSSGSARYVGFEELTSDEWNWRIGSAHQPPTNAYPALVQRNGSIEIAPQTVQFVNLTYVFNPPEVVWGWTPENNRKVYDENTSTDFTFGESDIPDLVYRILVMAATQIRDKDLMRLAIAERGKSEQV